MTGGSRRPIRGLAGLRALLRRGDVGPDIDEELACHIEMRARQLEEEGLGPADAVAEARRLFGDRERTRGEAVRAERRRVRRILRADALRVLGRDLRIAGRVWRRSPSLAALAVGALAIGTGVVSALFSIAHGVLVRDLPYPEADRLAFVHAAAPGADRYGLFSHQELVALRDGVEDVLIAGWSIARQPVTGAGIQPVELTYGRVTHGFFEVLGTTPLHGRTPVLEEYVGGLPVAVLGYDVWMSRLGGDPAVVGRQFDLAGSPHTVIGVMPPGVALPEGAAFWRPLTPTESEDDDREIAVIARLGAGLSLAGGSARVARALGAYEASLGVDPSETRTAWIGSARASLVRSVRTPLLLLLAAAGLVLLVACVNVSNLLLAHGESRRDQAAMRRALGASRASILRQHLAEALLLSLAGCALGLGAARFAMPLLLRIVPEGTPRVAEVGLDGTVVAAMALVAIATSVLTGLVPALRATRIAPHRLAATGRRVARGRSRLLEGFVTAQLSLSTLLVVGAALLGTSFLRLMSADRGFATSGALVVPLMLSERSRDAEGGQIAAYERIVEEVRAVPGVRSAHLVYHSPVEGRGFNLSMLSPSGLREDGVSRASVVTVTPGYLEAAGIQLLEGRPLAEADDEAGPGVAVASAAFARLVLPDGPAIGARFRHAAGPDGEPIDVTIVGVAADIRPDPGSEPDPILYVPFAQLPIPYAELLIRTTGDPASLLPALRERIWTVDADVPLNAAFTMDQAVADAVASPRFYMLVVGLFAGLALFLAAAGVYGVTAFGVSQRLPEIGVRAALGADPGRITGLFVRRGMRPVALGIAVGLLAALAGGRLARGLLYGIAAIEPGVYLGVAALLAAIGLAATVLPARHAANVDPLETLRRE